MTDWRDIVTTIQDFAAMFRLKTAHTEPERPLQSNIQPSLANYQQDWKGVKGLGMNGGTSSGTVPMKSEPLGSTAAPALPDVAGSRPKTPPTPGIDAREKRIIHEHAHGADVGVEHWKRLGGSHGGDGSFWAKKWWMG
jgi:hypothetical protein